MTRIKHFFSGLLVVCLLYGTSSCHQSATVKPLFKTLEHEETGLDFVNRLKNNAEFNVLKYIYFYNGGGVGAGDFNNDGKIDLFFCASQEQNRLYLNEGKLHFKDVTQASQIPNDGGWSTGVSVVDINNDGLLDIYVCRVGNYQILKSHNQFLINQGNDKNGIPHFVDKSKEYGLDFSGFSTQAAFFDYDNDGDLDMFLLNHSVHENGTFRPRGEFLGTYHDLSGDRIYRNDGGHFMDVTKETGINSSAIGYGLGICVADINLDGYPDIYVGNDFHEDDYLYINQRDGTFKETGMDALMHTSQFSMGVDVADANNDGYPEIISMDMLPSDPTILKRSLGEDTYDLFNMKIGYGYSYQYTRNNLQFNRRNGHFSETGLYSGVAPTDWSWSALWMDFDNDGKKDLFISNGIPKRMNDIDYIDYVSDDVVKQKMHSSTGDESDMALIEKFPQIKLPNRFFRNNGNLQFTDVGDQVKDGPDTYSNGAVYADLDNDGDLDVVVNNIEDPVTLYENTANNKPANRTLTVTLHGPDANRNAIGTKLLLYSAQSVQTYEKYPVHGFMSSMEQPVQIGLGDQKIDSLIVIWPDRTFEKVEVKDGAITVNYKNGLSTFDFSRFIVRDSSVYALQNITNQSGLNFLHQENHFQEFNREPLIPHTVSTEGPALAVGDVNKDGRDDIFIGGARGQAGVVFSQNSNGTFEKLAEPGVSADSMYEDVDACFADVNHDGSNDLIVASGGNEFYGQEEYRMPRVYLNDGKGSFTKKPDAFTNIFMTASTVVASDFDRDGNIDLFVGGRAVPWEYGQTPRSYLLKNDGTGKFTDVTEQVVPGLSQVGMVTQALWFDIDKDGDQDLLLAMEWDGIKACINNNGKFTIKQLTAQQGWWNFILPFDADNDGDIDLLAGNLGLNSRLKASEKEPLRLYYGDFDGNGKKEQILTYFVHGRELPFANKSELEKQMPLMRKQFRYAKVFAEASLDELFGAEKLASAQKRKADYLANTLFVNDGKLNFTPVALPWEAQLTSYRDAQLIDANGDNLPDVLLGGNFYGPNIEMGRYDADYGTILLNQGHDQFKATSIPGLVVKGEIRRIRKVNIKDAPGWILARNNDSTVLLTQPPVSKPGK